MALQVGELFAQLTMDSAPFDKEAGGLKSKIGGLGGAIATGLAGVAAGAVTALGGAMIGGIKLTDDYQRAMNNMQAATGATSDEMSEMGDSIKNLYANNMGESFEDVAASMTAVKQATGLVGDELESATNNALLMRDTFGYEVNESIAATDQLMKQFGISSEEAYTLIAQGAQNGLDKNGDMLDTINEYSVYFETMGFSAEDMFNTLAAGAESGAFNLDKVGDSMKEFGIRAKDGSDASADAFAILGLNASEMTAQFAAGGDKAQEAFGKTMDALTKLEDPVKRNEAAVNLFGTQFEDLEIDAILALGNVEGSITQTADTLEKINAVKYDSFGEAMAGIGRQLEVGLLLPLGELLLPLLNKFANWLAEKMPGIIAYFKDLGGKVMEAFTAMQPHIQRAQELFQQIGEKVMEVFNEWAPKFSEVQGVASEYFEFLKSGFKTMWEVVEPLIQLIGDKVMDVFGIIIEWWNSKGQELFENVKIVFESIWKVIEFIMPAIILTVEVAFEAIKAAVSAALDILSGLIKMFAGLFTGDWSKMWDGMKEIMSAAADFLSRIFELSIYSKILDWIKKLWSKTKEYFSNLWEDVKAGFSAFVGFIIDLVAGFVRGIIEGIAGMVRDAVNKFNEFKALGTAVFNGIREAIRTIIQKAVTDVTSRITTMKDKATGTFNALLSGAKTIFNNLKTAITKPIQTAKDTVAGIVEGIKSIFNNMKLKFPGIKMPKFSIGTKKDAFFGFDVPTFNVDWFKTGGIATGPAIAGIGEAGSEAIVPLAGRRMQPFSDAVGQQVAELLGKNGGGGGDINITLAVDGKAIAKATKKHSDELNERENRRDTRAGGYNID